WFFPIRGRHSAPSWTRFRLIPWSRFATSRDGSEQRSPMDREKVAGLVREVLRELGEDPKREGLVNTPTRVAAALEFLTSGYRTSPREIIEKAIFVQETHNMVIARDIEVYSLCEHHLLPFFGRCHIGYIAGGPVVGGRKLARLGRLF